MKKRNLRSLGAKVPIEMYDKVSEISRKSSCSNSDIVREGIDLVIEKHRAKVEDFTNTRVECEVADSIDDNVEKNNFRYAESAKKYFERWFQSESQQRTKNAKMMGTTIALATILLVKLLG